ncbi:hypothetical protein GOV11_00625 [Candidatus Woesearchaeota archaeon]|nr:hypothetical protein [Candidatus Woesearchaeota archaeon]
MNWGRLGNIALMVLLVLIVISQPTTAQACQVLTYDGWQADEDCDSAPDSIDNCPDIANADQYDMNRNGVGDVCDDLVEDVVVSPDNKVLSGEFAHLTVRMINNREYPIEGITVNANSADLKADESQVIPYLPVGEAAVLDFWLQTPKCAFTKSYPVTITTALYDPAQGIESTEVTTQTIYVERSDACGMADGPLDSTIINTFHKIDLDRGESTMVPLVLWNKGDESATYHVMLEDLQGWGSWRLDPAATITVPAGNEMTAFLFLSTNKDARPGTRKITARVTSEGQTVEIPLSVYVRVPYGEREQGSVWPLLLQMFIVLVLLFLIIAAVIVAIIHIDGRGKKSVKKSTKKRSTKRKSSKKRKSQKKRKTVAIEKAPKRKRETYY